MDRDVCASGLRPRRAVSAAVLLAMAGFAVPVSHAAEATTRLVTVDANGDEIGYEGATGIDGGIAVSADGRFVAFQHGGVLVPEDTNGIRDIYVRDIAYGANYLVSKSTSALANGPSGRPAMSSNGSFILFHSLATNLVDGVPDANPGRDIFVTDLYFGFTFFVSVDNLGVQWPGDSINPTVSDDGQRVAYDSTARLDPYDLNGGGWDIYVSDLFSFTTSVVSLNSQGQQANAPCVGAMISGNGRYVLFQSAASNLAPNDTNGVQDLFVRDLTQNKTVCVSVNAAGQAGNAPSGSTGSTVVPSSISRDGRLIAFQSTATNFGDPSGDMQIYVHDRDADEDGVFDEAGGIDTFKVSIPTPLGMSAPYFPISRPFISADGRYVTFQTDNPHWIGGSTPRMYVWMHDLTVGLTRLVSETYDGFPPNGACANAVMSGDGTKFLFESVATNMIAPPTSGWNNLYLRDRGSLGVPDCPGDLNISGHIDSTDLNMLLSDWGCKATPGQACPGDADHDGETDSVDLNIVLSVFGTACY